METQGLDLTSLDMQDTEVTPEPVAEAPPPSPPPQEPPAPASVEAKAEPVAEVKDERPRDPATGQFLPTEKPEPQVAQQVQKVIPLAAHLEERRRYQQEIAERDRRLQEIEARIKAVEPKQPEVDFVEDPKGYVDAKTEKALSEVESLKKEAETLREQQQFASFVNQVGGHEQAFIEKNPDYYDALAHMRSIRFQQAAEIYPEATQEQIQQAVAQEELRSAYQIMQTGRNPAEVTYKLAATYGYRKVEAKKPELKVELPKVAKAPVADPSSTLGSGSGGDGETEELVEDDVTPESVLTEIFGARFGKR